MFFLSPSVEFIHIRSPSSDPTHQRLCACMAQHYAHPLPPTLAQQDADPPELHASEVGQLDLDPGGHPHTQLRPQALGPGAPPSLPCPERPRTTQGPLGGGGGGGPAIGLGGPVRHPPGALGMYRPGSQGKSVRDPQ